MDVKRNIAVIGGGASGLFAAGKASEIGCSVVLYEKNKNHGVKLCITGKGRCNVTNDCTPKDVIDNIPTNPKFMYGALNAFPPSEVKNFFEGRGVPLKTERGNRVFPVSDRAKDIKEALVDYARENGVRFIHAEVKSLIIEDGACRGVRTEKGEFYYDSVIVCTGGLSYPRTGSTGDGLEFARSAGLNVTQVSPSLVPIETEEGWSHAMPGLALKNVGLHIIDTQSGGRVYDDFGEMLFTHFGLSGPMVLSASSHLRKIERGRYKAVIDLKPALDEKTLDERILSDFKKYSNKDFANSLGDLLPRSIIPVMVRLSGIDPAKKVNSISREERKNLLSRIKALTITLKAFRPIDEAIITCGGVDVKELDPKTMASKKVPGLYFAGEVIDVDAYTGGFNLQIAFSTAYLAATAQN